jgi:hypothetical protein
MSKIKTFLVQAFNGNSLLHGLALAFISALGTELLPIVNGGNLPDKAQLLLGLKIAIIAAISYCIKNGVFGTSNSTPQPTKLS